MPAYVLDTSALVKRWIAEPGSLRVRRLTALDAPHRVYVARLAIPELVGAITRRHRAARLADGDRRSVLALIHRELGERVRVIEISAEIWDRATRLAATRGLRGADAVHVAATAAVTAIHDATDRAAVVLVTADGEQAAAARAEGMPVEIPTDDAP